MLWPLVSAIYLPGLAPTDYKPGDQVELRVNKLTSTKTQMPHSFYYAPFCTPEVIIQQPTNLGETLMGEKIYNSAFEIRMDKTEYCKTLCTKQFDTHDVERLKSLIDDEYSVNWLLDSLPVTTRYSSGESSMTYMDGFPIGFRDESGTVYLHNHFTITVWAHAVDAEFLDTDLTKDHFRVVGFEVEPFSMKHSEHEGKAKCEVQELPVPQQLASDGGQVDFTYDVVFKQSDIHWASRWDAYLSAGDTGKIHWFSLLNSLTIVMFLSAMVAMIILRTLRRDISTYNELAFMEDAAEETGWKLVRADVFRRPPYPRFYAVLLGSGIQIMCMAAVVIAVGGMGFLSPAHRGMLVQAILLLFMLMGGVAGYVTARMYKYFNGNDWKNATIMVGVFYPGMVSALFFSLDLIIWGQASVGAVPFSTMIAVALMWFGISVPLVFVGAYFGFRKPTIEVPCRVNAIPRQIPEQPWFLCLPFMLGVGGVLPFGAVFTELYFIMSSIWMHRFYYLFGILFVVLIILIVTCAEISVAFTYFMLTSEDYRWWWTSYFVPASSGLYVFGYSFLYYYGKMDLNRLAAAILYFGYMGFVCLSFALMTGSVGALASFFFIRAIFGSIKCD